MNITVNKLPTATWNKLHMNEASVSLEESLIPCIPHAVYNSQEILWETGKKQPMQIPCSLDTVTESVPLDRAATEKNKKMKSPMILTYDYPSGIYSGARLSLYAETGSHLKALILLRGEPAASVFQAEIHARKDAVVDLYFLDLLGNESLCLNDMEGTLDENAEINLIRLDLGGSKIYSGVHMDLLGSSSVFHSETGYHVKADQLLDMNYVAVHQGTQTNCEMQVNGTLEEGAKKIFRGTIDFRKGCAGAKAAENENVMLMGEEVQNQTLPIILCKEEDVEGSHGASIGQLDEKVLFYLASRGISPEAAQAMIAQARIDAICEKIPVEEIRSEVREFERVRGASYGAKL